VAAVFIAVCLLALRINIDIATGGSESRGVARGEDILSVSDLLADPLRFVKMALYTTAVRMSDMLYTMTGKKLGWLDIPIRNYVVWGFLLAAFLAAVHYNPGRAGTLRSLIDIVRGRADNGSDEGNDKASASLSKLPAAAQELSASPELHSCSPTINRRDRIMFPVASVVAYIGMLVIFYIAWTKTNSPIIEGMQGRYLTPLLPMLLLLLNGQKLTRRRLTDKQLLLFTSFLQCTVLAAVYQIIICR
jgi:uncharacterized membrane protein